MSFEVTVLFLGPVVGIALVALRQLIPAKYIKDANVFERA